MKIIGLIGGMSWESSVLYYRIINEEIKNRLGGLQSAKCLLYSVNFAEIADYQAKGEWEKAGNSLGDAAYALENAGVDFILICTNTMHKVIDQVQERVTVPILHVADATALEVKKCELTSVGFLGTKYTMEQDFQLSKLHSHGLDVLVPNEQEREVVNKVIFEELCVGSIRKESKEYYMQVINRLIEEGVEGIILGCTEIGLLIKQEDVSVPIFDTAYIHAMAAVNKALEE
ncbi:aspartate/glutamate racemase family protein [Priestia taiwanensis]|uniref:Aspartate racemase n=1 Tax=Priestia taiwanensis TaxID=1347902 RepID=A0A917EMX0_9BACI|nr:aspartate/glutamate racemase family protein [Priestia taiwanensis]MBM7362338.1 aspartate racemase [Priestia taiwanensis]GGE61381.1 aspartate racemase [Priestia taiwanensis]